MQTKNDKMIFFDCYQTLLDVQLDRAKTDEQRGWEEFVNLIAKNHGVKIGASEFIDLLEKRKVDFYSDKDKTTQHHNLCTLVSDVFEKDLQTPLEKDEVSRLSYECRKIARGYARLYPKVADTLAVLAEKYMLSIASYAQGCFTQFELRELGIEKYFSYFVYSSDIVFKKESPEFYRECLRLVQKKPEDCVMVGNNYHEDIFMPTALGMNTVWIKNPATVSKNPKVLGEAKNMLDLADFDKLPQIIDRIFGI